MASKGRWLVPVMLLALSSGANLNHAQSCTQTWNSVNAVTQKQVLNGVACNPDPSDPAYVAVGKGAVVLSSWDGISWARRSVPGSSDDLYGAAYGGGIFVAMGVNGKIFRSTDNGVTWSPATSSGSTSDWIMDVTYGTTAGNGLFVAVATSGKIFGSRDGISWSAQTPSNPNPPLALNAVTYGSALFVAVGAKGTILKSPDNATWTVATSGVTDVLNDVTYHAKTTSTGTYVAVGENGRILTSPDGTQWTQYTTPVTATLYGVANNGTGFVAVGNDGKYFTSADGSSWVAGNLDGQPDLRACALGAGVLVAVGAQGYGGTIYTASDVNTWTIRALLADLNAGAFGAGLFAVSGAGGLLLTAEKGNSWALRDTGVSADLSGLAFGGGLFAAVGSGGVILTSPDGLAWEEKGSPVTADLNAVAFGSGLFVAAGDGGTLLKSQGGANWSAVTSGATSDLNGIAFGNGLWIAVGAGGALLTSRDATTWTPASSGTANSLYGAAWAGGQYLAVGASGTILTSPDGAAWTLRNSPVTDNLYGASQGPGLLWAAGGVAGSKGTLLSSTDGTTWKTVPNAGGNTALRGLMYSGGVSLTFGEAGRLMRSGCAPDLTSLNPPSGPVEGGTTVTLEGSTLTGLTAIRFGAVDIPSGAWTTVSDAQVTCVSPAASSEGTVTVMVTNLAGSAPSGKSFTYVSSEAPVITGVKALTNPFKLKVTGSHFHPVCTIKIGGTPVPQTVFKSASVVQAKGDGLKAMVPKGVAVQVTVVNDDGKSSEPFTYTR